MKIYQSLPHCLDKRIAIGACVALSAPYALFTRNIYVISEFLTHSACLGGMPYFLMPVDFISVSGLKGISMLASSLIRRTDCSEVTKNNAQKTIYFLGAAVTLGASAVNFWTNLTYGDRAAKQLSILYAAFGASFLHDLSK